MDTILGILGVAVSAGALAPVFWEKNLKQMALAIIVSVVAFGLTVAFIYRAYVAQREFQDAEEEIALLFNTSNPMSMDQIFKAADRLSYDVVRDAVEDMKSRGQLRSALVHVKDATGHEYTVRVYNGINWPIPE